MYSQWGRVLKTTHLLLNTTTERSKIWWRDFIIILETQMKFGTCRLVVFSILPIDHKDSSSPTPERRDILEIAPIIPTVLMLTNYQHARNAIKIIVKVISCHHSSEYCQWNTCFSWIIDPNDPLQTSFPVSENYPLGPDEIIVEGEALKPPDSRRPGMKFIAPVLLTGSFMTAACLFAY